MKIRKLLISSTTAISFFANAELPKLCTHPKLPQEIQAIRDSIEDTLTLTPKEEGFFEQWDKYNEALANFNETYKAEIEKVDALWKEIDEKQFPSELRFNSLLADDLDDSPLLADIKGACWKKVMGIDEYMKYNYCNQIQKMPAKYEWNNILTCTVERSQLLGVKLYK